MSLGFISLEELTNKLSPEDKEFYSDIIKRDKINTGTDRAGILRRMQCDQCQSCLSEYKSKFPGKPFGIKCVGIYDQTDYTLIQEASLAKGVDSTLEEIREVYDPAFWAEKHIMSKTSIGDIVPFKVRWYQAEALRCTSPRKVDRWGRGTGKTAAAVIEELHFLSSNKNTEVLVLCPSKNQAQLWWEEINFQIDNSPNKEFEVLQSKQQPVFFYLFANGSKLKIFTAGSKSGKGADSIRSQSPRRIRLEEQDFLCEADYAAIMPLMRRFPNVTFHGSSTPTGKRGMYWEMCKKFPDYKEIYHPIMDHPDWGTDTLNQEVCMAEAKTIDHYRHEWLAEFGEPDAGVFKSLFVDEAFTPYSLKTCMYIPSKRYVMGVDWNGKGTGTRIVVTEYDPESKKRRVVAHEVIDDARATTQKSFDKIVFLNKMWHCDHVYVDAGFGFVQDEMLKLIGVQAGIYDTDTAKLKYIKVIDFGANLETNKLVPNRNSDSKYTTEDKDISIKRRTKPFMVEGTVMAFETGLVEISREYTLLEEQLRGYRVKTWTKGGTADTYATDSDSGDHDLDAFMLSMLGIELNYGLWQTKEAVRRLVQIAHTGGWGVPSINFGQNNSIPNFSKEVENTPNIADVKKQLSGIPSRTEKSSLQEQYRLLYLSRNSYMAAPVDPGGSSGKIPSRTSAFSGTNKTGRSGFNFSSGNFNGKRFN
jgi:hypothetical protein